MRYRLHFTAKKVEGFTWDTSEVIESNELIELVFKFQMAVMKELNRIIEESKKEPFDDDIPF